MKNFTKFGMVALMMSAAAISSCNKSDGGSGTEGDNIVAVDIYCQYTLGVATSLESTTADLYNDWKDGFDEEFKGNGDADNEGSIADIVDGIVTILDEVNTAKIAEPFNDKNVYGVESWYSFNSWMDYRDNIYSVQNVFYGKVLDDDDRAAIKTKGDDVETGVAAANSLATKMSTANAINKTINAALVQLDALVDGDKPFRNYVLENYNDTISVTDKETITGICTAIAEIEDAFDTTYTAIGSSDEDEIVETFVDDVVLPTYKLLNEEAVKLLAAVTAYTSDMTQDNLDAACAQWKATRRPWEQSEAFLLGPVADNNYDPHMDSWPLDQTNINILLNLSSLAAPESFSVAYSDGVLGFHALEYTLFRNGEPRDLETFVDGDTVIIEGTSEMTE